MTQFIQLLVAGLALGSLYAVVAFGFVTVFKATSVLNFAHGTLFMLGAYLTSSMIARREMSLVVTVLMVVLVSAAIGAIIHFGIMRGMVGQALFTVVLATIGIELVLKALIQIFFGAEERGRVDILPRSSSEVGGVIIAHADLVLIGVSIAMVIGLVLLFQRTTLGFKMRAVADNLEAARVVGINPQVVFMASWIIAAVLAGVGGLLFSSYGSVVSLDLAGIGLRVFPAALIGGLASFPGAILGGVIVGVAEQFAGGYLGGEWRDVAPYAVMFVVLLLRPQGIFGKKEAQRV